jgi:hypothetical protein
MELRRLSVLVMIALVLLFAPRARAQMSETERKAAARAAYQEGIQLQDAGRYEEALARFEAAQKLFDAPTHQLHIAETQAATGKLVEASETYETLVRRSLPPGSPEVFVQAQQEAKLSVGPLRKRIPTLRVNVKPEPARLEALKVSVNGTQMPNELLGIARPVNPGRYRLTATATGYATPAPVELTVQEKDEKEIELVLRPAAAAVVTPVPPPYTDGGSAEPAAGAAPAAPPKRSGPTSTGLLVGVRIGALVPKGAVDGSTDFDAVATAGPAFGLDGMIRVARMLLLGATFELGSLGSPDRHALVERGVSAEVTTITTYLGATLGILPNVDKVSFLGDIGLGYRNVNTDIRIASQQFEQQFEQSVRGAELSLGAGISIPAGPIRIVPKAQVSFGSFASRDCPPSSQLAGCVSGPISDTAGHSFLFIGVALYYAKSFGKD